jgi:uncharacterized OsmC-like protein
MKINIKMKMKNELLVEEEKDEDDEEEEDMLIKICIRVKIFTIDLSKITYIE